MFKNSYKGKIVLITGHTGFKGTWLIIWLLKLGAKVVGISKDIPSKPSMFEALNLKEKITDYRFNIRDLEKLKEVIQKEKPDYIFHLAAQPLVSISYSNPIETITTNTLGTANLLESIREHEKPLILILITSDKAYNNVEWPWGYKETDSLGGKDIYSGSKAAAEIIIKSYWESFIKKKENIKLGICRAGNVIGGGDWAKDRIVVDCMKSWSNNESVTIRSPKATRPWQHVLEPLSGYLLLGSKLNESSDLDGEPFNFGPNADVNKTVEELINDLSKTWQQKQDVFHEVTDNIPFKESSLLKLNCDKSLFYLNWTPTLNYNQTIDLVGDWYSHFYGQKNNLYELSQKQIIFFENLNELKK